MDNKLPERKHPRLNSFDYSKNGYYFVTLCAKDRKHIFSRILVKADPSVPYIKQENICVSLTTVGDIIEKYIHSIESSYADTFVDSYVIMPDHIHLIVKILRENPAEERKALTAIIGAFKSLCSKKAGFPLWQASFYEHIIRNYEDLFETRKYIRDNPLKWYHENK